MPKIRKRKEKGKAIRSLVFVKRDHYVEKKLKMNHYVTPSLGKEGQQQSNIKGFLSSEVYYGKN